MADVQVRTLYPFDSTDGGELSFGVNEVLTITRQDIGDGWWEARNQNGKEGLIPEAYVEIVSLPEPTMPPPPPPPAATYLHQNNGPSGPPSSISSGPSSWTSASTAPSSSWAPSAEPQAPPPMAPLPAQPMAPPQSAGIKAQDSYEDWDDDWDDDDSSSTTSERPGEPSSYSGSHASSNKSSDSSKFGTVRKSFNRFNAFSKQGGDAYLFGTTAPVPDSEIKAVVLETADGPFWQTAEPFTCLIASPKKETKFHGMKSFIAYQLTPTFSNIQVSRRYKHFDWLHDRLVEKYTVMAIPPLPDKQIAGRYEEDFIQERMRQLQLWIDRMCRHPVVMHSDVFQHFLTCTDEKRWKVGKRNAEKDEYKGGKFFLTMQTPPTPLDHKQVEGQIERFGRFVKSMDDSVKHLCQVGENNMKKHQGSFKKEYQKMGHSFISLARSFEFDSRQAAHNLTQAMHNTGQTYDDIGKLFEEQPRYDLCPLLENLHEYKGLLSTFPDVLGVHKAASQKMEEQFAKLNESDAQAVQGKVEVISYACLAEMNHFQQYRVGDFKLMMQNYLKGQIQFYQKITEMLQTTLVHYDNA